MDVRGKTAIVTGSAVGVGRATALDLARRGANVVINYSRSEDDAREAVRLVEAAGAKALLVKADVSNDAQVRSMVRADGRRVRRAAHPREQRRRRRTSSASPTSTA